MKRRIIKQGHSTHTITLPAKWIQRYGFKAGDEVEMQEQGKSLVIQSDRDFFAKKVSFNVNGLPEALLFRTIVALYKKGYEEIELRFEEPVVRNREGQEINILNSIQEVVNQLIGAEIIQTSQKSCTIKQISAVEDSEFDNVLRRIFLLIKALAQDTYTHLLRSDYKSLASVEFQHNTVEKFVNFCLRLLNKKGHASFDKTSLYYYLIFQLEEITDVYKFIANDAVKNHPKISEKAMKAMEMTNESFNLFYDLFYNYTNDKICNLINRRWEMWKKIGEIEKTGSKDDIKFCCRLAVITVILLNLSETKLSLSLGD